MVKREIGRQTNLSIYRSSAVPTLSYVHELWVVTKRTRSRIQAAEMTFPRRVAGLSLEYRVRSCVIQEDLRVELFPLRNEKSQMSWLGKLGILSYTIVCLLLIFYLQMLLPCGELTLLLAE